MPRPLLHQKVRVYVEERIRSGEWPPGTVLPTEVELREQFGVSRSTVQHALGDLAQAGLVVRRRRTGTVVARTASEENLLRWTNLLAEGPELHGDHEVLDARVVPAGEAGTELPDVAPTTPVVRMRRLKRDVEGRPVAIELAAIPFEVAPRILEEDLGPLTTLSYFHRTGVPVARARLYIEPAVADDEAAGRLERQVGSPLFRIRRETHLDNGRIAEVFEALLVPDTVRLYVEQSVAPAARPRRGTT
jgi:GntR family transcriptional regulator